VVVGGRVVVVGGMVVVVGGIVVVVGGMVVEVVVSVAPAVRGLATSRSVVARRGGATLVSTRCRHVVTLSILPVGGGGARGGRSGGEV
jgi:hypothetical protein